MTLKNELREFIKRSRHFYLGDHFLILITYLLTMYGYCYEKIDLGHYWDLKGLAVLYKLKIRTFSFKIAGVMLHVP